MVIGWPVRVTPSYLPSEACHETALKCLLHAAVGILGVMDFSQPPNAQGGMPTDLEQAAQSRARMLQRVIGERQVLVQRLGELEVRHARGGHPGCLRQIEICILTTEGVLEAMETLGFRLFMEYRRLMAMLHR